ncbi:MAG: hypothetical protein ACLP50_07895 [Solirubrobacteraceae bacterium]
MTDLRKIFDAGSVKAPTGRSLKSLLEDANEEAQASIVQRSRREDDDLPGPPARAGV